MSELKGKVVLITGASAGIGRAAALAFARQGADLFVVARREDRLRELHSQCHSLGVKCEYISADIRSQENCSRVVDAALKKYAQIDLFINNAGVGTYSEFAQQNQVQLAEMIETNLAAPIYLARELIPHMYRRKSGTVINVTSVLAYRPLAMMSVYCATKYGLRGFSSALREESKKYGVHVGDFAPRLTKTEFAEHAGIDDRGGDSADEVGEKLVHFALSGKDEYIVSFSERVFIFVRNLFPGLADRLKSVFRN